MTSRHARSLRFLPVAASVFLAACLGNDDPNASGPLPPGANSPPEISGTPSSSATVGRSWFFQPSISDPDGDALTVSATNLPSWLSLDSSTGRLSGTPGEGDVRTWSGIQLRVSDGQATTSLPSFSLNVVTQAANTGTATLSWSPPTERADGSPIGQLAGYEVLYGQRSRDYDTVVEINNPGITRYMIESLGPGTWYFAVKAVTTDGLESAPSQEVSKTIGG